MKTSGHYDVGPRDPITKIRRKLKDAREHRHIYATAHLLRCLRQRGAPRASLYPRERTELLSMLRAARYGTPPLAEWIPRGYQVARILFALRANDVAGYTITARDIALIKQSARHYRDSRDPYAALQLYSLFETASLLEISIL